MYRILLVALLNLIIEPLAAQFSISDNHRFLLKAGKPFFWLGDTAWELFHKLNREEASRYLQRRSEQGFTVIQAVVLAELDGLHKPNAYGHMPLTDNDPLKPDEQYFEHVDYIIDKADSLNMNIALLPTWGDKVFKDQWGIGPEIFNITNADAYGTWIANRYKNRKNIIWVIGGDRVPRGAGDVAIWNSMANAILKATDGKAIMTFHTQPNKLGSAEWFHHEKWLSFNMFQNGHCRNEAIYDKISSVYNLPPAKPVMDGEPIYEDHPVCFNAADLNKSSAYDTRLYAYLDLFAGAHGHTYGCHDIWQMYSPGSTPLNGAGIYWYDALELPGANQMGFVRKLMESHPILDRVPDQSLIMENNYAPFERIQATRGKDYLFVYSAVGKPFTVALNKIKAGSLRAYWFDPRNGKTADIDLSTIKNRKFIPPSSGYGKDWVLVAEDAAKNYPKP